MVEKIEHFFKHKSQKTVKINDNESRFLREESVRMNCVIDIDLQTGIILTSDKTRGKIYQYSFKVPIGLSPAIDEENKRLLTQLMNICNGKVKIWLLSEHKRQLHDNMKMLKERVSQLDSSSLADVCVNRYRIMQTMEKMIYATGYIFVEEDIYRFEETAQSFLNLYQLMNEDLLEFIERLNNDPLGGDNFAFG